MTRAALGLAPRLWAVVLVALVALGGSWFVVPPVAALLLFLIGLTLLSVALLTFGLKVWHDRAAESLRSLTEALVAELPKEDAPAPMPAMDY